MARIRIDKPIRAVLLDELIAAGIDPLTPDGTSILQPDRDGNGGWLTVPDDREAATRAVIDAHDPAALDAAAAQDRTRFQQDVATVKAFLAAPAGTATDAQRDNVTKAFVRVMRRVVAELND